MAQINNDYNQNDNLTKIRSKYIIIKIFDNLEQNKLLNIIKYNKQYQKLMNIKLIDYIREYSKIEIEIIPEENKYGKFINISHKDKSHYHIYFNDNKEEIKKYSINKDDKISKIKIRLDHQVKSLSQLFYNCKCVVSIYFFKIL